MQNERSGSVSDISTQRSDELRYVRFIELPKETNACPLFCGLVDVRAELEISTSVWFDGKERRRKKNKKKYCKVG